MVSGKIEQTSTIILNSRENSEKDPGRQGKPIMILVDTDVLVDIQRQYPPAIAWLESLGKKTALAISGFSLFELMDGGKKINGTHKG